MKTIKERFENALDTFEFVVTATLFGFGVATGMIAAVSIFGKLSKLFA